jgi:hypothetical protein
MVKLLTPLDVREQPGGVKIFAELGVGILT